MANCPLPCDDFLKNYKEKDLIDGKTICPICGKEVTQEAINLARKVNKNTRYVYKL